MKKRIQELSMALGYEAHLSDAIHQMPIFIDSIKSVTNAMSEALHRVAVLGNAFSLEPSQRGNHVVVVVRAGTEGQRALLGELTMSFAEWAQLAQIAEVVGIHVVES